MSVLASAIAALERHQLHELADQLDAEASQLREALEFYADRSNWGITRWADGPHVEFLTVHEHPWKRAEDVLRVDKTGGSS